MTQRTVGTVAHPASNSGDMTIGNYTEDFMEENLFLVQC